MDKGRLVYASPRSFWHGNNILTHTKFILTPIRNKVIKLKKSGVKLFRKCLLYNILYIIYTNIYNLTVVLFHTVALEIRKFHPDVVGSKLSDGMFFF